VYGFSQGDEIKARVTASNIVGSGSAGSVSTVTTVLAQVVPHKPPTIPTRGTGTDTTQIVVDWDSLVDPENGGSAIIAYQLQWDAGTGGASFTDLIGEAAGFTGTTHTQDTSILAGQEYQLIYRAKNKYGWGEWSEPGTIIAAEAPAEPASIVTSIVDIFVKLYWTPPDDKSSDIVEYEVLIK